MEHATIRIEYAAAPAVIAGLSVLGAGFGWLAYAEGSGAGRLLLGVAAALCLAEGLRCALVRPTLAADARGVELALLTRRVGIEWSAVEDIGNERTSRRMATTRSLQIDVGDTVYSVAAYRLGAPVAEVLSALTELRPQRPG